MGPIPHTFMPMVPDFFYKHEYEMKAKSIIYGPLMSKYSKQTDTGQTAK